MASNNDSSEAGKAILLRQLKVLFGSSEDSDDASEEEMMLEQLLTLPSSSDVSEFMVQLVGNHKLDSIRDFVENVEKFQRGVPLVDAVESSTPQTTTTETKRILTENNKRNVSRQSTASPKSEISSTQKAATKSQQKLTKKNTTTISNSNNNKSALKTTRKQQPKQTNKSPTRNNNGRNNNQLGAGTMKTNKNKAAIQPKKKPVVPVSLQSTGQVCGCFGQIHTALGNCLSCGRIACVKEGLGSCINCGTIVLPPTAPTDESDAKLLKAWELKETLLQFDRETAQRTKIYDDQSDFYSAPSAWNSQQEQEAACIAQNERAQANLKSRQKTLLSIQME